MKDAATEVADVSFSWTWGSAASAAASFYFAYNPAMRRELPPDDAILCEKCGYILDHLPADTNCPECGKPVRESAEALDRHPPIVEREGPWITTRLRTLIDVITHPYSYFRTISIGSHSYQARFMTHVLLASSMAFGVVGALHLNWIFWFWGWSLRANEIYIIIGSSVIFFIITLIISILLIKLIAYLTLIEGRFWGYRLRRDVVKRVLCYHSSHLFLISILTLLIVAINLINARLRLMPTLSGSGYLYTLCAWVLLASGWLMSTYVSAMRAVMFANRIPPVKSSQFEHGSVSARPATLAS